MKYSSQTREKILITAGEGGHTARAIAIAERHPKADLSFITTREDPYIDTLKELGQVHYMIKPAPLHTPSYQPRRWITAMTQAAKIIAKERPDKLFGSGSNYMIPPILAAHLLRPSTTIIATESFVEIGKPSKALKKIARIADEIWVQWEEQLLYFPKTKYCGLLIPVHGTSGLKNGDKTYPSTKLMKAIQEGKRVKVKIRRDLDHGKQKRFIEFLKTKRILDQEEWTATHAQP